MKKFMIIPFIVMEFLGGCATTQSSIDVISTHYKVIIPPASMLRCGKVKLPSSFDSNKEVAQSYIKLWKHNNYCSNNMTAVKNYLDEAQTTVK